MKKGAIELETVVKLVIVLFVLILIIYFLTGGFESFANPIADVGQAVTSGQTGAIKAISE